jgi:hypothetical protein
MDDDGWMDGYGWMMMHGSCMIDDDGCMMMDG